MRGEPQPFLSTRKAQMELQSRFCVDFRVLNSVTRFDPFPLLMFEEATSNLYGSKYFTVLDSYSGFCQVSIKEEHKERTGFSAPSRHYEVNRLPFGLSNNTGSFQRLIDVVFKNLLGTECRIFVDNAIIFSDSAEEHALRFENVLCRFDEDNLQLHAGKCVFVQPQMHYLGFVLESGVSASPDKVQCVKTTRSLKASMRLGRSLVWSHFIGGACQILPN